MSHHDNEVLDGLYLKVGWPGTVATSDYHALAEKTVRLKKAKLKELLQEKRIPLRQGLLIHCLLNSIDCVRPLGVAAFVDDALEHNAIVAVLTQTQSDQSDDVWNALKPLLGEGAAQIAAITWPSPSSRPEMEEELSSKIQQKKREEAEAFVSSMNARRREKQVKMSIDPSFLQTAPPGHITHLSIFLICASIV